MGDNIMVYTIEELAQKQARRKVMYQGNHYGKGQCNLNSQEIIEKYKLGTREFYTIFVQACNNRRTRDGKEKIIFTPYDQLNTRRAARNIAKIDNKNLIEKNAEHFQLRYAHKLGYEMAKRNPGNSQESLKKHFEYHRYYTKEQFKRFVEGYNEYKAKNNLNSMTIPPYESFFPNGPSKLAWKHKEKNAEVNRLDVIYSKGYSKGQYAKSAEVYRDVHIDFPEYNEDEYKKYCAGFKAGIKKNIKVNTASEISFAEYKDLYSTGPQPKNTLEAEARKMQLRMTYIAGYNYGIADKAILTKEDMDIPNDLELYREWLNGYNRGDLKRAMNVKPHSDSDSDSDSESVYVNRPVLNLMHASKTDANANNEVFLSRPSRLFNKTS